MRMILLTLALIVHLIGIIVGVAIAINKGIDARSDSYSNKQFAVISSFYAVALALCFFSILV